MTAAPVVLAAMSEAELRRRIIDAAHLGGWRVTSMHDSRQQTWGTDPGWPDLFLVRGRRALALELKTERGRVSGGQYAWLAALRMAGIDARIVRPRDYAALRDELLWEGV